MKKPFPFTGKESKKEEKAEKKFGKAAFAKGEKKEAAFAKGEKKEAAFAKGGKAKKGC